MPWQTVGDSGRDLGFTDEPAAFRERIGGMSRDPRINAPVEPARERGEDAR